MLEVVIKCVSGVLIFNGDGAVELLRNGSTVLDSRVVDASEIAVDTTLLSVNSQITQNSSKILTTSTTPLSQISSETLYKSCTTLISETDSTIAISDSSKSLSRQCLCSPSSHTSAALSSSLEVTAPADINSDITEDSEEEEVFFSTFFYQ